MNLGECGARAVRFRACVGALARVGAVEWVGKGRRAGLLVTAGADGRIRMVIATTVPARTDTSMNNIFTIGASFGETATHGRMRLAIAPTTPARAAAAAAVSRAAGEGVDSDCRIRCRQRLEQGAITVCGSRVDGDWCFSSSVSFITHEGVDSDCLASLHDDRPLPTPFRFTGPRPLKNRTCFAEPSIANIFFINRSSIGV